MKCGDCQTHNVEIGVLEETLPDNKTLTSKETDDAKRDSSEKLNSFLYHVTHKVLERCLDVSQSPQ